MKYAGIGSRETPLDILELMTAEAGRLVYEDNAVLRSGGAKGADKAFELGCDVTLGDKEIFKSDEYCKRYDNQSSGFMGYDPDVWERAFEIAEEYHPNWGACRGFARKLHARNGFIVLGERLNDPVDFIVCWTEGGKLKGGTAQALRIAKDYNIPVLNYGQMFD